MKQLYISFYRAKKILWLFFLLMITTKTLAQTYTEVENNDNINATLTSSQTRIHAIANYQGTVTATNSDFWILSRKAHKATDQYLYFDRVWVNNNPNFDFRVWEYRGGNWGVTPVNIGTLRTLMQQSGIYSYTLKLPYSTNLNAQGNSNNYYAIEIFTGASSFNYDFHLNGSSVNGYYYCYSSNVLTPNVVQVDNSDLKIDFPNLNPDLGVIVKFSSTNSFSDYTNHYIQDQPLPTVATNNSYSGTGEHIAYVGRAGDMSANATQMTGLQRNRTYYYKVYYYNDCDGYINYSNGGLAGSQTTCPGNTPNGSTINTVTTNPTTITINTLNRPAGADANHGYIVKLSDTNSFSAPNSATDLPAVTTDYSGKTGEVVVYTGMVDSATGTTDDINQIITGLEVNTTYYLKVYSYILCGGKYNIEATGSPVYTSRYVCEAPLAVSSVNIEATGENAININSYTPSTVENGTLGYIIKVSDTDSFTTPTTLPNTVGTTYNTVTGGEQEVYVGDSFTPNVEVSGLNANTTYYVKVYAYNTCNGVAYFENSGSSTTAVATCGIPTGNSELNSFRIDLHWENRVSPIISNVPADAEGQVVKMNTENSFTDITGAIDNLPIANTTYSGSGEQVILAGAFPNGQAFTGNNLQPNTQYFFKIYSYKECGGKYYFSNTTDEISTYSAGVTSALVSNVVINNFTGNTFTLASFEAPTININGNPKGYIVKMNTSNSFSSYNFRSLLPVADADYKGGEQVVYIGNSTIPNQIITGLSSDTTYYFSIYAYTDSGSPYFLNSFQQTGYEFAIVNTATLQTPDITFDDITVNANGANFNLNATSNSSGQISYRVIDDGGTAMSLSGTNNEIVTIGSIPGTVIIEAYQEATGTHQSASKTIKLDIKGELATISGFIGYPVNTGVVTLDMTESLNSNSPGAYSFAIIGPTMGYSINGNLLNVNDVAGSIIIQVTQEASGSYGETVAYFSTLFYNENLRPKVSMAHNLFDFSIDMGESKTIQSALNVFNTATSYTIIDAGGTGSIIAGNVLTAGNRPGTVILRSATAEDSGYNATTKDVTVTITGTLSQNISFTEIEDKTYGDPTFDLMATSDSGLTVSYTSSDTSVATVSGNTVTIVGVGSTTITASQGGNAIYDPANDVTQVLRINKALQNISFEALEDVALGDPNFNLTATGGASGNPITYRSSNTTVATVSGNTVTIVGVGSTTITASQMGDENYENAVEVNQTLTVINPNIAITPKVYLQGAYTNPKTGEETLMRDDLRASGILPTTSPYQDNVAIDGSIFNVTGTNAIVDWIWVELRDANDAALVIDGRSALLQRDGDIVSYQDGISPIEFTQSSDSYYIVIKHRNHLNIRSANTYSLSSTNLVVDFSTTSAVILGGANAVIEMHANVYAMPVGDQDDNGQIQNADINAVIPLLGGSGYNKADMDLNGQIQNIDINTLINLNIGRGEQF